MPSLLTCTYSEAQTPYQLHYHNAHEIIFIKNGCAEFVINQRTYRAQAGQIVFISSLEEHMTHILEGPYLRYYALITTSQLAAMLPDPQLRSVFLSHPADFIHVFPVSGIADQVESLFSRIIQETQAQGPFHENIVSLSFLELMILCYRMDPSYFFRPSSALNSAVLDIQRYIDEHLSEQITIKGLAEQVYLSESYFSHTFKLWTGYSPQRYLILSRISLAKELLSQKDLSVDMVAIRCGFSTTSRFISCFKKETGITPGKFRARNGLPYGKAEG